MVVIVMLWEASFERALHTTDYCESHPLVALAGAYATIVASEQGVIGPCRAVARGVRKKNSEHEAENPNKAPKVTPYPPPYVINCLMRKVLSPQLPFREQLCFRISCSNSSRAMTQDPPCHLYLHLLTRYNPCMVYSLGDTHGVTGV